MISSEGTETTLFSRLAVIVLVFVDLMSSLFGGKSFIKSMHSGITLFTIIQNFYRLNIADQFEYSFISVGEFWSNERWNIRLFPVFI